MKIAVAQINPRLGDFKYNARLLLEGAERAARNKCDLVVYPECSLFGYPPFDLLERREIVEEQMKVLGELRKQWPQNLKGLVGVFTPNNSKKGRPYFNSIALVEKKTSQEKKIRFFHKQLLPTGDVFDEARFCESGDLTKNYFQIRGHRFFLTICEDIWAWPDSEGRSPYKCNPLETMKIRKKVDLVINLSASPYWPHKIQRRKELVTQTAKKFAAPALYCNLVGGQDELIFDGQSFAISPRGEVLFQLPAFTSKFAVFEIQRTKGKTVLIPIEENLSEQIASRISSRGFSLPEFSSDETHPTKIERGVSPVLVSSAALRLKRENSKSGGTRRSPGSGNRPGSKFSISDLMEIKNALVLGIQDFCSKNNLPKVHLGLSGGIDSAVVACLAVEALGPKQVSGLILPGPFSAPQSEKWALELARKLSISAETISIRESYQSLKEKLDSSLKLKSFSLVHENLQARLRGMILMAYSNANHSCLLNTSNKTELATGYSTLYGDLCGGLSPIGDLTKTQVYGLAGLYADVISEEIVSRPPTAELRENQKDQDSLPPYSELDAAVERIVTYDLPAKSKLDHWLLGVLAGSEFKRWQAPPILKVSPRSFGGGRRWPISSPAHRALSRSSK